MNKIEELFVEYTRQQPVRIEELPSSGSNRRYFRIFGDGISLIGAKGTSVDENIAFIEIAKHFKLRGLPVPQVLAVSKDKQYYLQEDLGDITLFNAISSGREQGGAYSQHEVELITKTISLLPKIQFEGGKGLDYSVCYPQPEFDDRMIWFDLNYFKYCFLKTTGLDFSEIELHNDFEKLAADLLKTSSGDTFLYRDFQARNVMLVNEMPYFIDFQGGRKGPFYYDLASFVWQAKANYSQELKCRLISAYKESLSSYITVPNKEFSENLRLFVLFRTLQVLGAYGFRGYFEKKPHFLQSVPFAIDNLRKLIVEPFVRYPYLQQILEKLTTMRQFSDLLQEKKLEVRIFSFSYKKGIPTDDSGNGGGYVFDCRAIENPGKYDHFKHFTGLDREVIKYLEDDGGVTVFLSHIYQLADAHVKRYMERKFTNLMFAFGCTGGQHRSVYCAQHLGEYLAKKYNITVKVIHREQGIEQEM